MQPIRRRRFRLALRLRAALSRCIPRVLLALLVGGPVASLQASPSWALLEESFTYPDGPLAEGASSPWRKQIGSPPAQVIGQALVLGPGDGAEAYLTRAFNQLGLRAETAPAIEARFSLKLSSADGATALQRGAVGTVLQFTSADGKQRRGRLLFRTLVDGTYQLGVTTKASNAVAWAETAFQADKSYSVLLIYQTGAGSTRFWVDPDAAGLLGAPLAESVDPDARPVSRVSVQCNSQHGPHRLWLDDLLIQPFGEIK